MTAEVHRFQSTSPLYRGRRKSHLIQVIISIFQSTSSIQRKTFSALLVFQDFIDFNPLPLYRGRLRVFFHSAILREISIHFLYTEEDFYMENRFKNGFNISIHFLYTEEDLFYSNYNLLVNDFNPLPLYRGRPLVRPTYRIFCNFNPLPLYRGRREIPMFCFPDTNFNPLPLYRGRHYQNILLMIVLYFNPLPLYRGRRRRSPFLIPASLFQSTSSIQRKTEAGGKHGSSYAISIHFLYTEEDFLSRCPSCHIIISIHFLYTEEDRKYQQINIPQ